MMQRTLEQWLDYQSGLNPKHIDLGLERAAGVWRALGAPLPARRVVTVAGTNGKGSSVALLEAVLRQAGYRVACYTSPHLQRYNERIRIDGQMLDDAAICAAFERVEQARGGTPLTYFEYGTLAALWLFAQGDPDAAVLEVGLGGRLDAVNIIDADVALITGIGLDHTDWLGDTLEQIGAEKAGIIRTGRPVVFAAPEMPKSVEEAAQARGAHLLRYGVDYRYQAGNVAWNWQGRTSSRSALPLPAMRGAIQMQNAAGMLQVLECLQDELPVDQRAVRSGLLSAKLRGRFEIHQRRCPWILDVAHNPQAARQLSRQLDDFFVRGNLYVVLGMLRDKAIHEVLAPLIGRVDHWYLLDLSAEPRGASAAELCDALPGASAGSVDDCHELKACLNALDRRAGEDDLVLVFGSFVTVGMALDWLEESAP